MAPEPTAAPETEPTDDELIRSTLAGKTRAYDILIKRHSRKLHARIPGSSLLECQGAGHMVILERHDDVNDEIDDLLALAQTKWEDRS